MKINQNDYEEEVGSGTVLVDITASWCGPCRMMAPIVESIAEDNAGTLRVVELDADENNDKITELGIKGIPTFILYQDGVEQTRIHGFQSKQKFVSALEPYLSA